MAFDILTRGVIPLYAIKEAMGVITTFFEVKARALEIAFNHQVRNPLLKMLVLKLKFKMLALKLKMKK